MRRIIVVFLLALLTGSVVGGVVGCGGGNAPTDGGSPSDSGVDAGAEPDSGTPPVDAGGDAGVDAGSDAGSDAGVDARVCSEELCNGLDDDCDGSTDEGFAEQRCGLGACEAVVPGCMDGVVPTCEPLPAGEELCGDGLDDDCDGATDEALTDLGGEVRVTTTPTASYVERMILAGGEHALLIQENPSSSQSIIHLQRLDMAGALLGGPSALTRMDARSSDSDLAWNGSEYGLVYWSYVTWPDDATYFQRLDATGAPIGAPLVLDEAPSSHPRIGWNGSEYATSWMSRVSSTVRWRRVSGAGAMLGTEIGLGPGHTGGTMRWTGSEWGVVWNQYDFGSSENRLYFTRVDASGSEIGSEQLLTADGGPGSGCCPSRNTFAFAWNGGGYGVLRRGPMSAPTFLEISAAGVATPEVAIDSVRINAPRLVALGGATGGYAALWYDTRDVFLLLLDSSGTIRASRMIAPLAFAGDLSFDGSALSVSWSEDRDGAYDVFFRRFTPACR